MALPNSKVKKHYGEKDMRTRFVTLFVTVVIVLGIAYSAPMPAAGQIVPGYENTRNPIGANGQVVNRSAVPRMNGKPDFTGVFAGPGFQHKVGAYDTDVPSLAHIEDKALPPFKPGGESFMYRKEIGDLLVDDPTALCLPNGFPRMIFSFYAQQWIQAPNAMVVIYEYQHQPRVIPIGAPNRPHSPDLEKTWYGESLGWWEGDTFVIDTTGMKEWWWDASHMPTKWHSDQFHMVERLTWTDPMTVSYKITFDDPKIFTRPWTQDFGMKLHPSWKILEFVCEENNRCRAGNCTKSDAQ